jgi:hypothetical protein
MKKNKPTQGGGLAGHSTSSPPNGVIGHGPETESLTHPFAGAAVGFGVNVAVPDPAGGSTS